MITNGGSNLNVAGGFGSTATQSTTTLGGTAFGRGTSITNGGLNTNLSAGKFPSADQQVVTPRRHSGTPWPERRGRRCERGTPLSASQQVFTAPGLAGPSSSRSRKPSGVG
jgi:hypothetical protein